MNRTLTGLTVLSIVVAASACSKGGAEKTQVVARVNDAEITVSQLHNVLIAKGQLDADQEATRQALEGLINEQLLVDAALRSQARPRPGLHAGHGGDASAASRASLPRARGAAEAGD